MRRFGSKEAEEQDLISTVMFHKDYIDRLLQMGERDAAAACRRDRQAAGEIGHAGLFFRGRSCAIN